MTRRQWLVPNEAPPGWPEAWVTLAEACCIFEGQPRPDQPKGWPDITIEHIERELWAWDNSEPHIWCYRPLGPRELWSWIDHGLLDSAINPTHELWVRREDVARLSLVRMREMASVVALLRKYVVR